MQIKISAFITSANVAYPSSTLKLRKMYCFVVRMVLIPMQEGPQPECEILKS